jgi:hypothetical protein
LLFEWKIRKGSDQKMMAFSLYFLLSCKEIGKRSWNKKPVDGFAGLLHDRLPNHQWVVLFFNLKT